MQHKKDEDDKVMFKKWGRQENEYLHHTTYIQETIACKTLIK
jgi:hypothetical protein